MARKVRISTIGACNVYIPYEDGLENAVQMMIEHWKKELAPVLCDQPDLIVLPECCDRSMSFTREQMREYYDYRGDRILNFFMQVAKENHCYIAYPTIWAGGDGKNRNSVLMIDRDGRLMGIYDKYHMTDYEMPGCDGVCGEGAKVFECDFGTVGVLICFDLNFEPIRNLYNQKRPDLMLFCSSYHGYFMQNFFAYNNRCYFVSAVANNESAFINPVGEKIARTTNYYHYLTHEINLDFAVIHLDGNEKKIIAAKEKYGNKITVFDPGELGAVLLTSETDELTANDLVKEFDFELLDDYFNRSMKLQDENRFPRVSDMPYEK